MTVKNYTPWNPTPEELEQYKREAAQWDARYEDDEDDDADND
jgi:hypothetical protein